MEGMPWLGRDKTCLYNCVGGARDIFCKVTFKLNNVKVGAITCWKKCYNGIVTLDQSRKFN